MLSLREPDLLQEFKSKCMQNFGKIPDNYFDQYLQSTCIKFNLSTFIQKDIQFAQLLFTLPINKIEIFTEDLSDEKIQQKISDFAIRSLMHKSESALKITTILNLVNESLLPQSNQRIRILKFINVPMESEWLNIISSGIEKTNHLKELTLQNCNINDNAVQILQSSLSLNVSLVSLNLSKNFLQKCTHSIIKILSVHGQRKKEILNLYRAKNITPQFIISNTGIYDINLQANRFTSPSLEELIAFLYQDKWAKSINLKNNQIKQETVNHFATLIRQNTTLLNLDLRQNPGFNKKYSKIIFYQLKQNIWNSKNSHSSQNICNSTKLHPQKHHNLFQSIHSPKINQSSSKNNNSSENDQNSRQNSTSLRQFNKLPISKQGNQLSNKQKIKIDTSNHSPNQFSPSKLYPFQRVMTDKKIKTYQNSRLGKKGSFAQKSENEKKKMNKTALISDLSTSNHKKMQMKVELKREQEQSHSCNCLKCKQYQMKALLNGQKLRQMQFRMLKAEKESVELQLELKRLKRLLTRNMDVSAIVGPSSKSRLVLQTPPNLLSVQSANISNSFNRLLPTENESDIVSKLQLMVLELTKIMETVEMFQNTENTIEHPFQNVNSFSKTVSLYEKPKDLLEVQREMLEDENLHLEQFGEDEELVFQRPEDEQVLDI